MSQLNEIEDKFPEAFHKSIGRIEAFLDLEFPDNDVEKPRGVYYVCIFFKPGEGFDKAPGIILSQIKPDSLPRLLHKIADGDGYGMMLSDPPNLAKRIKDKIIPNKDGPKPYLDGWKSTIDWKQASEKILADMRGALDRFNDGLGETMGTTGEDQELINAAALFIKKAGHLAGAVTALHDDLALALGKEQYPKK